MTIHVVKAGETVGSIAEFYGVDVIRHREPLWDHSPVPVAEQLFFEGKTYDPGR